jgi:hypothetical protein
MDLQTARATNGLKWSWARNAALILFFVTGILLVASLTTAHSQQPGARMSLLAGHIWHTNSLL